VVAAEGSEAAGVVALAVLVEAAPAVEGRAAVGRND